MSNQKKTHPNNSLKTKLLRRKIIHRLFFISKTIAIFKPYSE